MSLADLFEQATQLLITQGLDPKIAGPKVAQICINYVLPLMNEAKNGRR